MDQRNEPNWGKQLGTESVGAMIQTTRHHNINKQKQTNNKQSNVCIRTTGHPHTKEQPKTDWPLSSPDHNTPHKTTSSHTEKTPVIPANEETIPSGSTEPRKHLQCIVQNLKEVFKSIHNPHYEATVFEVLRTIKEVTKWYATYASKVDGPSHGWLFQVPLQERITQSSYQMHLLLNTWGPVLKKYYPNPADLPDIPMQTLKRKADEAKGSWTRWNRSYEDHSDQGRGNESCYYGSDSDDDYFDYDNTNDITATGNSITNDQPQPWITMATKLSGLSEEALQQLEQEFLVFPPLEPADTQVTVIVTHNDISDEQIDKDSDNTPLTQATSQPASVPRDKKLHRVSFTWREWVYDETGKCSITYSKWANRSRINQVYAKETWYGDRLNKAQLESHQKHKLARAAHQALLKSVDKEYDNLKTKQKLNTIRNSSAALTFPTPQVIKSSSPPPEDEPPIIDTITHTPITTTPPKMVAETTSHHTKQYKDQMHSHYMTTITHRKIYSNWAALGHYHHTKNSMAINTHKEQQNTNPQTPHIQVAKGQWVLHSSQPPYLLPLPWQHHSWLSPAHRKTLRQQPF
jgi:hypothetical protein